MQPEEFLSLMVRLVQMKVAFMQREG